MKPKQLLTDTRPRRQRSLKDDARGATVLEYIILACLVIGVCFAIVSQLGTSTQTKFQAANTAVTGMSFGN
jgi:Flp pilus assembly pilin Flp